ncbi:hypothetical protein SAMN05421810_1023 [Amycolatopsis arida]|uniref:DhaL domain-containing protein n=1 Tax=Amycolatopsis arida TaxID=587909 RepID=A0A1I5NSY9_9PSEU|nr:hypothetical protein CLV69_1013 [Amycolatopsis arida]SFP24351.1 hypothetical protein SAMN05421810_1023 [Amycolatopsis arida]
MTAWAAACVRILEDLRDEIDGINVYPVADSDTGSNLLHTLSGAHAELAATELAGAGPALGVLARGAVRAARGNSGVIISQVLRGLADSAGDRAELDGPALAAALLRADRAAAEAVAHPMPGTMLTVLHAAAAAVDGHTGDVPEVARAAASAAAAALPETPWQLPVLAAAGVVDAGARGVVAVLDALVAVVTGHPVESGRTTAAAGCAPRQAPPAPSRPVDAWEVMYLLDGVAEDALPALRAALSDLGDSVTVAGDGAGSHAVHVHCGDIGAAIEAGLVAGRPHRIRVEPLFSPPLVEETTAGASRASRASRAVVAVVRGTGLAELIRAEDVPVLAVPAGAAPSIEELLGLIGETGAAHVTVLPGDAELTEAADRIADHPVLADRDVVVVPCVSPVQVLAALAVHDATRRTSDDVVAMAEAAAATRRGELRIASGEAITWVGRVHAGDVVGLVDGEVVLIEPGHADLLGPATAVLNRMLDLGGELVTVLVGAAAPADTADVLAERLRAERPEVELVCYPSGQADTVLLIGVE